MQLSETRPVKFHLLSRYYGDESKAYVSTSPRSLSGLIQLEVGGGEYIWEAARRAIVADVTGIVPEIVKQRVSDGIFYLTMWRAGQPWREHDDETYLIYSFDGIGGLQLHPWLDHQRITLDEIEDVAEAGYLLGDPHQFVIHTHEGSGGDFGVWDIATWLYQQGVDIGVPLLRDGLVVWLWSGATRRFRNSRADRRSRGVAWDWSNRNIEAPFQLRQFLDTKRDWTVAEVDRRLFGKRNEVASSQLLTALGFAPDAGQVWWLGTSKKAIRRRAKWMKAEERENLIL